MKEMTQDEAYEEICEYKQNEHLATMLAAKLFKNFDELYYGYLFCKAQLDGKHIPSFNKRILKGLKINPTLHKLTARGMAVIVGNIKYHIDRLLPWERKIIELYYETPDASFEKIARWFIENGVEQNEKNIKKIIGDEDISVILEDEPKKGDMAYARLTYAVDKAYSQGLILYPRNLRYRENVRTQFMRINDLISWETFMHNKSIDKEK